MKFKTKYEHFVFKETKIINTGRFLLNFKYFMRSNVKSKTEISTVFDNSLYDPKININTGLIFFNNIKIAVFQINFR